jgi:hypothetical protein
MHHRHEDTVILLNSEVVDFTMKVIVKGQTLSGDTGGSADTSEYPCERLE